MRIEQLQQVLKVAEVGSINRAARELFMSQSNLSQSLQGLERETGRPVFVRSGAGVRLTPFGCEFIAYAQSVCTQFGQLNAFCKNSDRPAPRFSVASYYMRFSHTLFIRLYQKYAGENVRFSFFECPFLEIVESVQMQRAELGILLLSERQRKVTMQMFRDRGLVYHPFARYPAAVTVGPKNPLFAREEDSVTTAELSAFSMILYQDSVFDFTSELEELGLGGQTGRITVSDRSSMHEFIRATDAYSVAAHTGAYSSVEYYDNIRALRLRDRSILLELGYVVNVSRPLSPMAREYLELMQGVLAVK